MDQDDDNHPDRILKQAAYMESHPELTISATPSMTETPWVSLKTDDEVKFDLFFNNEFGHPNLMVRRDFLKKNNIRYNLDYKCANDYEWLIQIRDKGGVFGGMSEALFIYNGPNYSVVGGPCYEESRKIMRRWSELDIGAEQYVCNIMELILSDPKYQQMFSDGFLDAIEKRQQELCHSIRK